MSRFIETLLIKEGRVRNLAYHQRRVERTVQRFYGRASFDLAPLLIHAPSAGSFRCRVTYDRVPTEVEYLPYRRTERTKLLALQSDLDYNYKYRDRDRLDALGRQAAGAGCDEALIIQEGDVTDTTIANVALFDGRRWLTPARPLLRGTMRQRLLDAHRLVPATIPLARLGEFSHIALMNALSGFYVAGRIEDTIRMKR